jgi:hypothetical protein
MRLLNTLRLLVRASPPTTGVAPGAVYYDTTCVEPRYYDGASWQTFGEIGFPQVTTAFVVPDGRQVTYFDQFRNDGVLTIEGSGVLVGTPAAGGASGSATGGRLTVSTLQPDSASDGDFWFDPGTGNL